MFQEITAVNIFYTAQQYEAIYIESALANILENEASLDTTTPVDPNPSLPRTALKLAHVINPVDHTKPIPLQHYSPVTLQISMDILSSDTITTGGLSDRYLACSVRFPKELWTPEAIMLPHWFRPPDLLDNPPAALWSSYKLAPSIQNLKCTHIKDLTITVPVEQLSYQTGTDAPKQFFPDELGFISTVPPRKFPREMNVDFSPATPRNLDMSYNRLEDHFQDLTFQITPPKEPHGHNAREPNNPHTRILRQRGNPLSKEQHDAISLTAKATNTQENVATERTAPPETRQPAPTHEPSTGQVRPTPPTPELSPVNTEGATAAPGTVPAMLSLGTSASDLLESPTTPLDSSNSTGMNVTSGHSTSIDLTLTNTSVDTEIQDQVQLFSGPHPPDHAGDTFHLPPGLLLNKTVPPKDSAGTTTRLAKKAQNLSEEHILFLSQLLEHVNQIPQESITMSFREPLVYFDLDTKQFMQDQSMATSHNIQALERLIELDAKDKENLFQQMGKNFFSMFGKIIKQFPRKHKD